MYEYMKNLLLFAEIIGTPKEINLDTDCRYVGNRVRIEGETTDGSKYVLELTIKKKEGPADA